MTLLLPLLAFALLAAGTHRQARILFGRPPPWRRRRALLGAGHATLLLSLWLRVAGPGRPRALVEWFGDLSFCALLVVLVLWAAEFVRLSSAARRGSPARGSDSR